MDQFIKKKIFITGHTGFKGTWLLHILHHFGAELKGYALPAPEQSMYNITQANKLCASSESDIRDQEYLIKEIIDFQPDYIFHLAAQPLVLDSYKLPVYTFEVNQMGTVYLLEALRKLKKKCICVVITTDKVYKDLYRSEPYSEDDLLGGFDPYSASKAGCELIVESYRNSFFHPDNYATHKKSLASARAGNVIGGGDFSANRLIPDIVKSIEENTEVVIRNPKAVRPWQHVLDALFGYLTLAAQLEINPDDKMMNTAWNFGPYSADMWPVEKVANTFIEQYGKGKIKIEGKRSYQPKETHLLTLDINKALKHLPWHPVWDAGQAIYKTIAWYQNYIARPQRMEEVTTDQIKDFLRRL